MRNRPLIFILSCFAFALCTTLAAASAAGSDREQDGRRSQTSESKGSNTHLPSRWWANEQYVQELKLTSEQAAKIDKIFQESMDRMKVDKDELDRAQSDFAQLMKRPTSSERELLRAADLLEVARFSVSKARTSMLVRIHTVLTAEQRLGLQAILKRSDGDRNNRSR